MADYDMIGDTPLQILDQFIESYYIAHGETIRIGSEEYAFASVCSYVISVYLNACDDAAKNRFVETARGKWLDAIAAGYGIFERPGATPASASFRLVADGTFPASFPAGTIKCRAQGGAVFSNIWDVVLNGAVSYATLFAEDAGASGNGIAPGAWDVVAGAPPISAASTAYATAGGVDSMAGDDESFRAWLIQKIRSFAGSGTAKAYEGRALSTDPRVLDAYVLRQDDAGYIAGKVQLFITVDDADVEDASPILDAVEHAVKADDFRPIGDLVLVDLAELQDKDAGITIRATYEPRFYTLADERNDRILEAYLAELRKKIGAPFRWAELTARLCAVDDDGIYATDAVCEGMGLGDDSPIYPDPGCVINVQGITINTVSG